MIIGSLLWKAGGKRPVVGGDQMPKGVEGSGSGDSRLALDVLGN